MRYYVIGLFASFVFAFLVSCLTRPTIQNVVPVQIVDIPIMQQVVTAPLHNQIHTHIGDLNCDGAIDFSDINLFVDALTCEKKYVFELRQTLHSYDRASDCTYRGFLPYPFAADCNLDGVVDMADINPFVDILLGGPIPNFVPIIGWSRFQDDPQGRELYDPATEPSPE